MIGEVIGQTELGKVSLRSYRTNANLDATVMRTFRYKYRVHETKKGRTNFHVPGFEEAVQLTTNDVVMIFGGQGEHDEEILRALKQDVITRDDQPFKWMFQKKVTAYKETKAQMMRLSQIMHDYVMKYNERTTPIRRGANPSSS